MLAIVSSLAKLPATRQTKRSPRLLSNAYSGAIRESGVGRVVFGAFDVRAGAAGSRYDIVGDGRLGGVPTISSGVRGEDSATLLREFFVNHRG